MVVLSLLKIIHFRSAMEGFESTTSESTVNCTEFYTTEVGKEQPLSQRGL